MNDVPRKPRVCLCVLMNHPFPANLPLLRRIYGGRFSTIRFLIPFERMPDEDVITVYRGSYNHASFLTDAHRDLAEVDCDHYFVIHDDVLLNPAITEENLAETFGLGPNDGFIPAVGPTPEAIDQSIWWFGLVPKLLFPKSILFGTGVEPAAFGKYLPDRGALEQAIAKSGVQVRTSTYLHPPSVTPSMFGHPPSRLLLHGLAAPIHDAAEAQQAVERNSLAAERGLVEAMLGTKQIETGGGERIELPLPMVMANYYTDVYVVPKSGFDDYCHYVGIAGAANLFVEVLAPTLLHACCERVRTAASQGLDFSGFDEMKTLDWLYDRSHVAIHPFKLSPYRQADDAEHLLELLRTIAAGEAIPGTAVARAGFGSALSGALGVGPGWHHVEPWGVWSSGHEAVIPVLLSGPAPVQIRLLAPRAPQAPASTGRLIFNDGETLPIDSHGEQTELTVLIPRLVPDSDGVARIRLVSDRLVQPSAEQPGNLDSRMLGYAFLGLTIGAPAASTLLGGGWHRPEDWGSWSAGQEAIAAVPMARPGPLRVTVVAPPLNGTTARRISGRVEVSGKSHAFEMTFPQNTATIHVPQAAPEADGLVRVRLVNDDLIVPRDVDPAFGDTRRLGAGLVSVEMETV